MKKMYTVLPLFFLLSSCGESVKRNIKEQAETIKDKVSGNEKKDTVNTWTAENLRINYFQPLENRHSEFMLMPIDLSNTQEKEDERYDGLHSNLLFFNPKSGQVNYIDTSFVGMISNYYILSSQKPALDKDGDVIQDHYHYFGKNTNSNLIFLQMASSSIETQKKVDRSYGKSSYYDAQGGHNRYLATVRNDGSNFVTLTPVESNLRWWTFLEEGKSVLASALVDSDKNGKFEKTDEKQLFYIDMNQPKMGTTIISSETKDALINDYLKRKADFDKRTEANK